MELRKIWLLLLVSRDQLREAGRWNTRPASATDHHRKRLRAGLAWTSILEHFGITPMDVEVTITETPPHNWGFRGLPGDEHSLNYKVNV